MMRAAIVLPIPGRLSSSLAVAVLMFTRDSLGVVGSAKTCAAWGSVAHAFAKKHEQRERHRTKLLAAER